MRGRTRLNALGPGRMCRKQGHHVKSLEYNDLGGWPESQNGRGCSAEGSEARPLFSGPGDSARGV